MSAGSVVFLNHSCVIVEQPGVDGPGTRVLCDPWFQGSAFNDGWRLLHENSHDINDIACEHIWISHEHPDHFSIPTLSRLTSPRHFLYQKTDDGKVRDWLRRKGHDVTELADGATTTLGDLKLTTFLSDGYDCAALFELADGSRFLNLNDARVDLGETLANIQRAAPGGIDMLALQFSYANWAGNEGDEQIPQHQQQLIMERLVAACQALKPKRVMLFASFVFYSHEENFHWNRFWLPQVMAELEALGIDVVLPVPNQRIPLRNLPADELARLNAEGLAFWRGQAGNERIRDRADKTKTLADVQAAFHDFHTRLWQDNSAEMVRNDANAGFKLRVLLPELRHCVDLHLFEPRIEALPPGEDNNDDAWDVQLSCETLIFLLKNRFGRGTVTVNGRLQFHYPTAHRFFLYFFVPYANNIGRYFRTERLPVRALRSVARTSVLMSIFKFDAAAPARFEEDLALFG